MYRYRLYGKSFSSPINLDLPQAPPDADSEYQIKFHRSNGARRVDQIYAKTSKARGSTLIHYQGLRFFCVRRAICIPRNLETTRTGLRLLSKSIIPIALATAGEVVLHASAFSINGRGYLAIGESGAGKSTLASYAALQAGAHLADDAVRLSVQDGEVLIEDSNAGVYLTDESFGFLARFRKSLRLTPQERYDPKGKLFLSPEAFTKPLGAPQKLECVLCLTPNGAPLEIGTARARLSLLLSSVYLSSVMLAAQPDRYLDMFSRIVRTIPFRAIGRERIDATFSSTESLYEQLIGQC